MKDINILAFYANFWCINIDPVADTFKLTSGVVHNLPKNEGENPNQHFKKFIALCSTIKPNNVVEEVFKRKVFSFALIDSTRIWLLNLTPQHGSIYKRNTTYH